MDCIVGDPLSVIIIIRIIISFVLFRTPLFRRGGRGGVIYFCGGLDYLIDMAENGGKKGSTLKRFFSRSSSSGSMKRRSSGTSAPGSRLKLKETDPMLNALFENIVDIQNVLMKLRSDVESFLTGIDAMCGGMKVLSEGIHDACKNDEALSKDTDKYRSIVDSLMNMESNPDDPSKSARRTLREFVENKVRGPIEVNLVVLSNVLRRMLERDAKLSSARKSGRKAPDQAETQCLFDELTALHQHRFDFIRGPYQALKKAQHVFFSQCTDTLASSLGMAPRPTTSADPKKAPPALMSPSAKEMLQRSSGNVGDYNDAEITDTDGESDDEERRKMSALKKKKSKQQRQKKKILELTGDEPIKIATPIDGAFDPSADAPSGGRIYAMLGKASDKDAIGTRLTKDEPDTELMKKAKALKLTGLKSSGSVKIKLSVKGFKSSGSSSSLRRQSSSNISLSVPVENGNGEIPMKIAPMAPPPDSGEIPMKIAPMAPPSDSGEIPMKIAPMAPPPDNGEIPMKIAPMAPPSDSGEIPMKIAPEQKRPKSSKKKKKKKPPSNAKVNLPDADESSTPDILAEGGHSTPSPEEEIEQKEMQRRKSLSEALGLDEDDFGSVILDEQ